MARRGGSLNFLASETIDILPDCIDMHLVVIDMRHLKSASLTNLESSFRIILEFQYVETLGSRLEFYNTLLCMDLEDTITIRAGIGHSEFASQAVERKDVGNSTRELKYTGVLPKLASIMVDIVLLLQWT